MCFLSIAVSQALGRFTNPFSSLPASGFGLAGWIVMKFLYQFFFFNGTWEEVGRRGFTLPRLQFHISPLVAGIAHASVNTVTTMMGNMDTIVMAGIFYVFVAIIVVSDRMWRKLPENHPAVIRNTF